MTNILPLLFIAGGAALLMRKKKKKKKKNGERCPEEVTLAEQTNAGMVAMMKSAMEDGGGDPILAADILFQQLVPAGCTKSDYQTKVVSKQLSGFKSLDWNLSMFYAHLVSATLSEGIDSDDERAAAQARSVMDKISTWYSQLTGEPLPDID